MLTEILVVGCRKRIGDVIAVWFCPKLVIHFEEYGIGDASPVAVTRCLAI